MRLSVFSCFDGAHRRDSASLPAWAADLPVCRTTVLVLFVLLLIALYVVYKDYSTFISLGPGGTPSNFGGYLRVTFLRFFALRNPRSPSTLPAASLSETGYLANRPTKIHHRFGPRPSVSGIAPHRQTSQQGGPIRVAALAKQIRALQAANTDILRLETSCFEKHGTGLFALSPVTTTCKGEICHAHPSDGSLHLTLHPADARIVLERGWGERHPLAKGGWLTRFVPVGFMMVYAPRSPAELEVAMEIIRAAAWYVSGRTLRETSDHPNLVSKA